VTSFLTATLTPAGTFGHVVHGKSTVVEIRQSGRRMAPIVTTETTGEGQDRAREERQRLETRHVSSPSVCFFSFFSYFLSTKLLFTFRTTAMTTNGHATPSTHLNTSKRRQRQQQLELSACPLFTFLPRRRVLSMPRLHTFAPSFSPPTRYHDPFTARPEHLNRV
jgi:hypothetical protein